MRTRRAVTVGIFTAWLGGACHCPGAIPTPDGGVDAGRRDAGPPDAGAPDAGLSDAGLSDAGLSDAGLSDAGLSDAGLSDAGPSDAGPSDAGPSDAGLSDAGPRDAGPPDAGEGFCGAFLDALCAWYSRCGQLDPAQRSDCRALNAWTCSQEQLDAVLDAGKISVATARVSGCLLGLADAGCEASFPRSAACDGLFAPAASVGQTCTRQWSTLCSAGYCAGNGCPATCAPFLPLDAGCSADEGDACGPSAYCAFGPPRVCAPYLSPGAACVANDRCLGAVCDSAQSRCLEPGSQAADAGCGSDLVCEGGLYCNAGSCRPREVLGGPCRLYGGHDCDDAFTCRLHDGGSTGTCQPRAPIGGPCYGLPNDCQAPLLCDTPALFAPGTCVGFQSEGAACSRALQNCKVGLICDVSARCRVLPRLSDPCVRDPANFRGSDCAGGFCPASDGGAARCAAPQAPLAPCERPWECASTECSAGVCAELCTRF